MSKKCKVQYVGYVHVKKKNHNKEELFVLKFFTSDKEEVRQSLERFKNSFCNTSMNIVDMWIEKDNKEGI